MKKVFKKQIPTKKFEPYLEAPTLNLELNQSNVIQNQAYQISNLNPNFQSQTEPPNHDPFANYISNEEKRKSFQIQHDTTLNNEIPEHEINQNKFSSKNDRGNTPEAFPQNTDNVNHNQNNFHDSPKSEQSGPKYSHGKESNPNIKSPDNSQIKNQENSNNKESDVLQSNSLKGSNPQFNQNCVDNKSQHSSNSLNRDSKLEEKIKLASLNNISSKGGSIQVKVSGPASGQGSQPKKGGLNEEIKEKTSLIHEEYGPSNNEEEEEDKNLKAHIENKKSSHIHHSNPKEAEFFQNQLSNTQKNEPKPIDQIPIQYEIELTDAPFPRRFDLKNMTTNYSTFNTNPKKNVMDKTKKMQNNFSNNY